MLAALATRRGPRGGDVERRARRRRRRARAVVARRLPARDRVGARRCGRAACASASSVWRRRSCPSSSSTRPTSSSWASRRRAMIAPGRRRDALRASSTARRHRPRRAAVPALGSVGATSARRFRVPFAGRPAGGAFPLLASRGCPEFCTYCPHRILASHRARSVGNILDELAHLVAAHPRPYVVFRDPLFTEDRDARARALRRHSRAAGST